MDQLTYLACLILMFCCVCITQNVCSQDQAQSQLPHCMKELLPSKDAGFSHMTFNFSRCLLSNVIKIEEEENVIVLGKPTELRCGHNTNAGIWISQVANLTLRNLSLTGCGVLHNRTTSRNIAHHFRSAAIIEQCTNVTLQTVVISGSCGTGLIMLDNDGVVHINNCSFKSNSLNSGQLEYDTISGGSGLHIELSNCGCRPLHKSYINYCTNDISKNISNSTYFISNCHFVENNRKSCPTYSLREQKIVPGFGVGGGMALLVGGYSKGNRFHIEESTFINNTASWGGGLYIVVQDESTCNEIVVDAATFQSNNLHFSSGIGGGIDVGFMLSESINEPNNSIRFINCTISKNQAKYGGGGHFFSSSSKTASNSIEMVNCNWTNNLASFGAAFEVTPNLWGANSHAGFVMTMKDNRLVENYVVIFTNQITSAGRGAILADKVNIRFSGNILFEKNNGSALCLESSEALFEANSHIQFIDNQGFQGGAIAMTGYSVLKFSDNSTFLFANNSALDGGGALSQLAVSTRDIQISRACFLQYCGKQKAIKDYNTSFIFVNNSGAPRGRESIEPSRFGHSILTTTIKTCAQSIEDSHQLNQNETLAFIANFTFINQNRYDLSTLESSVSTNQKLTYIVPGKITDLGLKTRDDFSNEVAAVFHVSVKYSSRNKPITIDSKFTYTSNGQVRLFGKPGGKGILVLESTTIRKAATEIQVVIQECPPGYIFQNNNNKGECACFSEKNHLFTGILVCNKTNFQVSVLYGYWMGYDTNETFGKDGDLFFSYCYLGRCLVSEDTSIALPENTDASVLNSFFCGERRTGILCGKCKSNLSMNYHSRTFICSLSSNKCQLGWFYYILSELVPVTVLFAVTAAFDIRPASGSVNSLILFMQLSDLLQLHGNGFIKFPSFSKWLLEVYFLFVRIFNIEFFGIEGLSFCLWQSATASDLLAFKYLTILYALGLVFSIILFLKYCNMKCFKIFKKGLILVPLTNSIIHGLSGFLILCYSEAIRISLLLLTPATLYSLGNDSRLHSRFRVAASDGDLLFFQGKHLVYAIPALFVLLVLGVAPPVLLFIYPLCYKLFGLLKISESRFIKALCIMIPLEKFKPFFDSFQSGFKDECRFFAGLYFLYRLMTLALFVLVGQPLTFYIAIAVQFLVMIVLHMSFQPFKIQKHNKVDVLLFTDLLLINLLTIWNYSLTNYYSHKYVSTSIQILLLYMPLIIAFINVGRKVIRIVDTKIRNKREDRQLLNYHRFSAFLDAAESRCVNSTGF